MRSLVPRPPKPCSNAGGSTLLIESEIGSIVNGYTQFSLVENQLAAVDEGHGGGVQPVSGGAKKVFVISGRAGSGKSLVALTLLGQALDAGRSAGYVSGVSRRGRPSSVAPKGDAARSPR